MDVLDVEEHVHEVISDRSGRKAVRLLYGLRHSSAPAARATLAARLRVTWTMRKRSKRRSDEGGRSRSCSTYLGLLAPLPPWSDEGSAGSSDGASLGLKAALLARSDESVQVALRFKAYFLEQHNMSNISPMPAPTPAQKGFPSDGGDQGHIPQSVPLFAINEQPSMPEDGDQGHIPQSVPLFDLNELPATPEDGVSDSKQ